MSTMLITFNGTRQNGNFMGDQLCYLKIAYLMVRNQPDTHKVIMALSPENEMDFVWNRFLRDPRGDGSIPPVEVVFDTFDPGDWYSRWEMWDKVRRERVIENKPFDHYRELYLRIHGVQRQAALCGLERGAGRRNIYEYVYYGQEHNPEDCEGSTIYDCVIDHPVLTAERDVYISPHCKTQGNYTFTFEYWAQVVRKLLDAGVSVTVGYDGPFCDDLIHHPLYQKHWGSHWQWVEQLCKHKLVACGNTGTGWLAAACEVPLITMEPPNSQMPDHRYRECGLRNLVEVLSEPDADYCAKRIIEEVYRKTVMTTGCYDVLHAGHVRHLERARAMGTRLVVALNSDESVRTLKGSTRPINPEGQRKIVLEALRCVDEVRIFDGPNALPLIEQLKPDVLACGYGYTEDTIVGKEVVESYGGRVAVTCDNDASNDVSTTKIVERVLRSGDVVEICRIGARHSVNPYEKLKVMADEFLKVAHLSGEVADLGSYRGGSALILRRLAPEKKLHLFDTWMGIPFDDELCDHKKGEWASSIDDCRTLVGTASNTYYHQCIISNPVPQYIANNGYTYVKESKFCFVYVDVDTYLSTRDAIDFFLPRMVKGGKMVFDDYGWRACAGVKLAVDNAFPTTRKVIENLYTCVVTI